MDPLQLLETPIAPAWGEHLMALVLLLLTLTTLAESGLRLTARALDAYVDATAGKRDDALVKPWTRRMLSAANALAGILDWVTRYLPVLRRGGR